MMRAAAGVAVAACLAVATVAAAAENGKTYGAGVKLTTATPIASLLGQKVERIALVSLGKDMAVYYGWPRSASAADNLVFWLALDCACSAGNPAVAGLAPEVEQIGDAIVKSIEVIR